jgi:hypothetical protein
MSSQFRKARLQIQKRNGWAVAQKNPLRAWISLPHGKIEKGEGPAADSLLVKAKAAGIETQWISDSWIALPTGMDLQVYSLLQDMLYLPLL